MIKLHPKMSEKAFTGCFYIINQKTGYAIQSERTKEKADAECRFLNDHSKRMTIKHDTELCEYYVQEGTW